LSQRSGNGFGRGGDIARTLQIRERGDYENQERGNNPHHDEQFDQRKAGTCGGARRRKAQARRKKGVAEE
jgi:hypothetical protein